MKNIVIPILGAVSIISTGAVAWLLATPPSVDPRAVKLESELQEARQTIARLKAELARKPGPAPTVAQPGSVPGEPVPVNEGAAPAQGNVQDMLRSPAMRAMIDKQQAAQIEVGYARLFDQLGLNPEEKQNFKALLAARQKMMTDLSLQLLDRSLTPEKRQALLDEAKHQQSVYNASIQQFLNDPNDFQTFQQWDGTLPERNQYDTMGRSLFSAAGEPLSPTQEQQLIMLMAEVRSTSPVGGLNDQTGTDPNKLNDEIIAQQMAQLDANTDDIAKRAQPFLTPVQREALGRYLAQIKEVSRSNLDMSKMIIQGNPQK